jgi:hypothetical protein
MKPSHPLVLLATTLLTAAALGQSGGDRCDNAQLITTGIDYQWTTAGFRADGSCSCFDRTPRVKPDLYFKYIADQDGFLLASTCGSPVSDAGLAIFQGCGGRELACNDDRCGFLPEAGTMVLAGREYIIRLAATVVNQPRTGKLRLTFEPRCLLRKPFGALVENEPCGERLNDGCFGSDASAVERASLGQTYYGTFWGLADGTLDHDSYEFVVPVQQVVTITAQSPLDILLRLYRRGCNATRPFTENFSDLCSSTRLEFNLPAGTYRAVIRVLPPANNNDCGLPFHNNNYLLTIGDPDPLCKPDFNGDGFVDFFDYDGFVRCFTTPNACPDYTDADITGDGFTDFTDYDAFVGAFEAGC